MKIYIPCIGSRGDHQPFIALGEELKQRGHEVILGVHEKYAAFCEGRGIETRLIRGNLEDALTWVYFEHVQSANNVLYRSRQTPEGQAIQKASMFTAFSRIKAVFTPLVNQWFEDIHNHVEELKPDVIAATTVAGIVRHSCITRTFSEGSRWLLYSNWQVGTRIMEKSGAKCVYINTVPNYPTRWVLYPHGFCSSTVCFHVLTINVKFLRSPYYGKLPVHVPDAQ